MSHLMPNNITPESVMEQETSRAGLGGGTGTGAIQILADELKRATGALVVGVVTLPFAVERFRYTMAKEALLGLQKSCDTVVAIDNNRLTRVAGNLPLQQALGVAKELVTRSLPQDVRIVWGARVDPAMKGKARVMVVLTGVESTFGETKIAQAPVQEEKKKRFLGMF